MGTVPVGANVAAVSDFSLQNDFVDMMKQARAFTSLARPYQPANLGPDGWPTEDFQVIFQSGFLNTAHLYNGTYKLSFTGQAAVSPAFTPGGSISNLAYDPSTNTTTADFTVNADDSQDGWYIVLDFSNTNGAVKNIKLIRPGYDPNTTQVFTNQFLAELAPFDTLRVMDFTGTNNNPTVNWSDRTLPTAPSQATGNGAAWEYAIDLANATHENLWINIPEGATDDYVTRLATLLKNQLEPGLAVYVEYSNELWNGGFQQTQANKDAAVAEVEAGMASGNPSNLFYPGETAKNPDGTWVSQWDWAWRRIARQAAQISHDFAAVWGQGAIDNQIRPVLASQIVNPYIVQSGLQFIEQTYGPPRQFLYAIAGAPYFNLGGQDSQTNLTESQVLSALTASMNQQSAFYPAYIDLATYYGLRDLAYEGGPDTFGPNNVAAKAAASLAPAMESLVISYLDQWFSDGGGLFNWYYGGASNYNTAFGTWGLTNDPTNLNTPKMLGVESVLSSSPPPLTIGAPVPGTVSANNYVGAPATTDPYLRNLHDGAALDYLLRAPQSGTYDLRINYAAVNPGGQLEVLLNDNVVTTLTLPVTGPDTDSQGAPDDFADSQAVALQLNAGLNVVRLKVVVEGFTLNQLGCSASNNQSSPPTVVSPAAANPNPVAGTATALSVLGADAGGEASLTYTWSVLGQPAGAPPPTFSANGTNAAKNVTATFGAAGDYVFQATIENAAGLTATSSVNVAVVQTPTSLTVTPESVALTDGASRQFTAVVRDQFGAPLASQPTFGWSAGGTAGGTVDANGLYTAPSSGAGTDTVQASADGLSGGGTVVVTSGSTNGPNFPNGFASASGLTINGSAAITSDGRLRLTDGHVWEGGSAYFSTKVGVSSFTTTFSFQLTNPTADGFAFVIQALDPTLVGAYGGGLGYAGIPRSVAVKFDLHDDAGEGSDSTGLYTDGAYPETPAIDLSNTGIDLHSGHVFNVAMTYDGTTLAVTITDAVTGASATQRYAVDIPGVIGASTAYVGFSGSSGGLTAVQDILNWTYSAG
jgi:hypothetical protein